MVEFNSETVWSFVYWESFNYCFNLLSRSVFVILFRLHWVLVALCALSLVAVSMGCLSCSTQASFCDGFSCVEHRLRHVGFSSCGTWAQLLCGMWTLPGSGIETMPPVLAGRFLSTVPSGKVQSLNFFRFSISL